LSILAGQTSLALESSRREVALQRQRAELDQEVRHRTADLTKANAALQQHLQETDLELKKAHDEIGRLSLADRLRDSLMAATSHELRNPLGVIIGSLDLIREEWRELLPPEGQQLLDACARNSASLLTMLSDLLDVSVLRGDPVVLYPQNLSFGPLVQRTFDALDSMAQTHNVKLLNTVPQDIDIYADAGRLQQVLIALVSYAIKNSKRNGAYVLVGAAQEGRQVTVGVTDNGIGLSREQQEQLFQPLIVEENDGLTTRRGASLSLALCKSLVERHGGRIWVEGTPGKGNRIFFSLPSAPTDVSRAA
jgi:signal transduction histidine kinase